MLKLQHPTLVDCLDALCSVTGKRQTEMMTEMYFEALSDLDNDLVTKAFGLTLDDRNFPGPARIRELVVGVTADADWLTIMAVANGSKKSATISGISAIALTTATATGSILAALKKISFCDDPYTLRELRKDWTKLVSIPRLDTALPPADVQITLVVKTDPCSFEHPTDDDFSVRTASMLRCIKEKGCVSPAWMPIIDKFPAAKKREIMDKVEENGWITPALTQSSLYRKHQSTAEAMREIDEAEINGIINAERKVAMAADFGSTEPQQILEDW
jgi:hypothetical protein